MPGSDPKTNGDLSADIRNLERALENCALQVETIKQCQDDLDAETRQPAQSPDRISAGAEQKPGNAAPVYR
nr:phage lysis protein [Citrobacter amalonaticus]